jgi:signal transduction histidine kinase
VPTLGGVVVINPKSLHSNDLLPPVHITRMVTDDMEVGVFDKVDIPPGVLRYEFQFTALSLLAPSKNKYKYKLENFDRNWNIADNTREAIYTNLSPGKYVFRVIASNNDGVWNTEGASLEFVVLPYYYQTTWFYVGVVVVVALLLLAIYKYRIRVVEQRNNELRKLNTELDRFVYSASHDLRAPLASIMGLVTLSRIEKENQEEYLDMIERSVKRLDGFISDIIDYSRNARLEVMPEAIDFEKTIHAIFDNVKFLDHQNKIRRHVTIHGTGQFFSDRVRLDIILNNIISNAVKYHNLNQEDPTIEVRVWHDARKATIQVIDNGQGISEEHHNNIFKMFYRANSDSKGSGLGLYIVSETVQKLGGQLQFESKLGAGSLFTVILPTMKV